MRHLSLLLAIWVIPGIAADIAPQTPAGHLARAAGARIGANEQLRAFAATECSYVLKRKAGATAVMIESEFLPAFQAESRKEAKDSLSRAQAMTESQSRSAVLAMIESATREYGGDRKTACGFIGGTLVGSFLRTTDSWYAARIQYGVRDK